MAIPTPKTFNQIVGDIVYKAVYETLDNPQQYDGETMLCILQQAFSEYHLKKLSVVLRKKAIKGGNKNGKKSKS